MVGEELEGDDVEEALEAVDGLGNPNHAVRISSDVEIRVVRDDDRCAWRGR